MTELYDHLGGRVRLPGTRKLRAKGTGSGGLWIAKVQARLTMTARRRQVMKPCDEITPMG